MVGRLSQLVHDVFCKAYTVYVPFSYAQVTVILACSMSPRLAPYGQATSFCSRLMSSSLATRIAWQRELKSTL